MLQYQRDRPRGDEPVAPQRDGSVADFALQHRRAAPAAPPATAAATAASLTKLPAEEGDCDIKRVSKAMGGRKAALLTTTTHGKAARIERLPVQTHSQSLRTRPRPRCLASPRPPPAQQGAARPERPPALPRRHRCRDRRPGGPAVGTLPPPAPPPTAGTTLIVLAASDGSWGEEGGAKRGGDEMRMRAWMRAAHRLQEEEPGAGAECGGEGVGRGRREELE